MKGIHRFGLRFVGVAAFLAFAGGCSVWVLGVVQSFGSQNGPKISTIVGNGAGGSSGDGGPAIAAELHQPYAVAVDPSGNLYIADGLNNAIRKVGANGTISTVALGLNSPEGVAVNTVTGDIYISDTGNGVIKKLVGSSVSSAVASLNDPAGVATDSSGNLYIADMGNSRILEVDKAGTLLPTVAGIVGSPGYSVDGTTANAAHLNYPTAVAVDNISDALYIADGLNFVIRKVVGGNIYTVAGNGVNGDTGDGGPALAAELSQPYGLAVDASGNLYISELNSVVRKVDTNGIISTVAGNAHLGAGYGGDGNVATAAMLNEPWGLAIDSSGNLLIADRINNRIRKVALAQ